MTVRLDENTCFIIMLSSIKRRLFALVFPYARLIVLHTENVRNEKGISERTYIEVDMYLNILRAAERDSRFLPSPRNAKMCLNKYENTENLTRARD